MNGVVRSVRNVTRTVQNVGGDKFRGALFIPLNKSGKLVTNHPLDNELEEYYRVIDEIVIPDCMEIGQDITGYGERIKELISYTNPAFHDCWNFGVELTYKLIAPPEHQTKENLTKIRLLRAAMDLTFTMSAVIDDIADGSNFRRGKKAWHTICKGDVWAGLYDGSVLGYLPFHILRKHFRKDAGYPYLMEAFAMGNLKMLVGETIDMMGQGSELTHQQHRNIITYKAGHYVSIMPAIGMLHAGITDEKIIKQMMNIFLEIGNLIQTWDDFNDYYSSVEDTGKPPCDFQNAGTTWVSATAIQNFTPEQEKLFKECYGSPDPDKIEIVKRLYDEIDIPNKYLEHMRKSFLVMEPMIKALPDEKLQNVCYSELDWLIGDVIPTQ